MIAVVDEFGKPIVLRRLDGAQVASVDVAMDKARSAAVFRRPSEELEDQVRDGRFGALQLAGGVTLQGGIPLTVDGRAVGAIGSAARRLDEDEAVALAGAQALR